MLYLQKDDGSLFASTFSERDGTIIGMYANGWHKIARAEYRKLMRMHKHSHSLDHRAQGESADEREG